MSPEIETITRYVKKIIKDDNVDIQYDEKNNIGTGMRDGKLILSVQYKYEYEWGGVLVMVHMDKKYHARLPYEIINDLKHRKWLDTMREHDRRNIAYAINVLSELTK